MVDVYREGANRSHYTLWFCNEFFRFTRSSLGDDAASLLINSARYAAMRQGKGQVYLINVNFVNVC